MPAGTIESLGIVQIGEESAHAAAAATEILLAKATVTPTGELYRNTAPHGAMAEHAGPTARLTSGVDVDLEFDGVTYEQLPWLLNIGLDDHATTGAGPYVHTDAPPGAALWTPLSASLETRRDDGGGGGASDLEDEQVNYMMARTIELSGEMGQQVQAKANCFGQKLVAEAGFASLTVGTTFNHMLMRHCKVFFNNTWAAAATEPPAAGDLPGSIVINFALTINTGLWPFEGVGDSDFFAEEKQNPPSVALRIRTLYEPNAAVEGAAAERVHAAAEDLRFVTLQWLGDGNMVCRIVCALKHEKPDFQSLSSHEGYEAVEMNLLGHYDPTGAALVQAIVENDRADPLIDA